MEKVLRLYKYIDGINDIAFPNEKEQAIITSFRYDAKRMGAAPTISFSLMHSLCLDSLWDNKVYALFNGERFYVKQTPTNSYSSSDTRYKHEVELVSERFILDNIYFYDVVSSSSQDKPVSNSSKFSFFGNIKEYVSRLNNSLNKSNVGYSVVIDDDILSDEALMSIESQVTFEDQVITNALQEIYNVYKIPYYFVGKTIHVGYYQDNIDTVFKYGCKNSLISISKTNANSKVINKITGVGSSDNIPYYYPNVDEKGITQVLCNGREGKAKIKDLAKYRKVKLADKFVFHKTIQSLVPLIDKDDYSFGDFRDEGLSDDEKQRVSIDFYYTFTLNQFENVEFSVTTTYEDSLDLRYEIFNPSGQYVGYYKEDKTMQLTGGNYQFVIRWSFLSKEPMIGSDDVIKNFVSQYLKVKANIVVDSSNAWTKNNIPVTLSDYGISVNNPSDGDVLTIERLAYIQPQPNLVPPIYRDTEGGERFYEAINGKYKNEQGGYYQFDNEYTSTNPREHIENFDDIKPTIKNVVNGSGYYIDEFIDFAYDLEDNDETDESGKLIHPYFFGKLRRFDGEFGFNLFDHAIDEGEMVVSMTSGTCGSCEFIIGVDEQSQKNIVQVDTDGNLVRDNNGNVRRTGTPQDRQNDTKNNEVWIALKKDIQTFGVVMPNAGKNYRPKAKDKFVLIHIDLPQKYVEAAENALKDKLIKYMHENNFEKFNFSIAFSRIYFAENPTILANLSENSKIQIEYNNNIYDLYVSSLSYSIANDSALPEVKVELEDALTISKNQITQAVESTKREIISSIDKNVFWSDIKGVPTWITSDKPRYSYSELSGRGASSLGSDEWTKMFILNKSTGLIDVLKTFSSAVFNKIFLKEKGIIDIKRNVDSDDEYLLDENGNIKLDEQGNPIYNPIYVPVSDETIPTTSWVNKHSDEKYLSKLEDDTAKGNITFEKNIGSHDFVKGNLMGAGWSIYKDANGNTVVETDTIIARKGINASELIINQETFQKGSNIFVKGGCTITKVEIANGRYRCYYDNEEGRRFSGFKVGDQARCQRYNASYGGVIKYYWRLVTGVEEDYVELSMTDCDGTGIPEEGDDIAQLGSRYDKTRQSAIVISPDNGGSVIIWAGIDSFDLSEKNMVGMGVNPNTGRAYLYGYGDMFFGDRSLEKNYITYQTRDGETEPTLNINADIHFGKGSDGLSNLSEFKNIQNEVDNLFGQIEREFTIWYYDYEPTLDNEPAVNWVTDSDKALHDQDIFFSDKLARAWRFVNGAWVEITDERTLSALKLAEDAHAAAAEAEKNAREAKEYIDNILPSKLEELQNQIDGAIESFFYKYDPTTSNEPASFWTTEEQKAMHLNDTFTNLESGYSWRWTVNGGVYGWTEISDTATVKALVAAGQAQDTADQKRRVFVATPYTPYDEGDLWVQGETGDILQCSNSRASGNFDSSDWVKASKYTDDSALQSFIENDYKAQLASIQSQMDKRAETWYQVEDPSLAWTTQELKQLHAGDLWYNINKGLSYMWSGTEWVIQGVPDEVFDTIDGKASIYTSQPSSYKKNDLWILASDTTLDKAYKSGTIVVAKQDSNVFVKEHWTKKDCYTDDSAVTEFINGAYKNQIDEIKGQIDKKSETWYQNTDPSLNWYTTQKNEHKGDLWYNTNEDQTYIWSGTIWIPQGVPDEVFDKIDGKAQIFASRPNSYNKNDLWVLEQDMTLDKDYKKGTIVIAATSSNYFVAAHWTKLDRYTDDSRADEAYGKAEEAYRKAESFSEDLSGVLADMDVVMNQVDREFTIWYYNHVPTLNNAPAVDWDTVEEKQRHDQDICFADELARAWRFVNGQWVEITDERTLAALKISEDAKSDAEDAKKNAEEAKEQATAAANRVANVEYLKDTFGKNETIIDGGVYISKLVSVKNEEENIEAFLNGSDVGKDAEHGKLILAGGIPESGGNLEARSRNALTRIYEDGTLISDNVKVKGEINATSGTFDNVHINGTIRTKWEVLRYKVLYYSSSSVEQWGFDGSAISSDKIILTGGIGTPELWMAWGDDADGREIVICNKCIRTTNQVELGLAVKVIVPTGKYIVDLDGTKTSGGNSFNIEGKKIYYMIGFNEGWYVTNILNLND